MIIANYNKDYIWSRWKSTISTLFGKQYPCSFGGGDKTYLPHLESINNNAILNASHSRGHVNSIICGSFTAN